MSCSRSSFKAEMRAKVVVVVLVFFFPSFLFSLMLNQISNLNYETGSIVVFKRGRDCRFDFMPTADLKHL